MGLCSEPIEQPTESETVTTPAPEEDESTANVIVPGALLSHSLPTIADTWLEFNDTQPFGEKKRLKVDGMETRATLLKFNLTSLAEVTSVKEIVGISLKLYSLTDSVFGGKVDSLSEDCNDWDEYEISWTNAPDCAFNGPTAPELVGSFEEDILAYEWNEAALSHGFDTELPELITLRVTSHYANGVTYASRENVTAVPELIVYYTLPVPTQSPFTGIPTPFVSAAPTKSSSPTVEIVPTESPTEDPSFTPTVSICIVSCLILIRLFFPDKFT